MSRQKNFRSVPPWIRAGLEGIPSRTIVVGCALRIPREDLAAGEFDDLRLSMTDKDLTFPALIVPPASAGKHSNWNVNGREIVRDDLPLETLYNAVETPNWGDPSNGTHTVYLPYQRYPRDFVAPRYSSIEIECLDVRPDRPEYFVRFSVSEVLNRDAADFDARLFDCLNLLQENVGHVGVKAAGATLKDYVRTLKVSWEFFPPGTAEEAIQRLYGDRKPTAEEARVVEDRHRFFMSLKPEKIVYGSSGFQRYFGAMVNSELVVFENVEHGNAIYVMFETWKDLSRRSRVELLSGRAGDRFERVVHSGAWKQRVRDIIDAAEKN